MAVAKEKEGNTNKRRHGRRRTLFGGTLFANDGHETECFISDISTSGARVRLKEDIPLGTDVDLKINKYDFFLQARVAWIREGYTGLEFKVPLDPEKDDIARLFSLIAK